MILWLLFWAIFLIGVLFIHGAFRDQSLLVESTCPITLYFDTGHGFNARESIRKDSVAHTIHFMDIDWSKIQGLRIDPAIRASETAKINTLILRDGFSVWRLRGKDLANLVTSTRNVAELKGDGTTLIVHPDAGTPQLVIRPEGTLAELIRAKKNKSASFGLSPLMWWCIIAWGILCMFLGAHASEILTWRWGGRPIAAARISQAALMAILALFATICSWAYFFSPAFLNLRAEATYAAGCLIVSAFLGRHMLQVVRDLAAGSRKSAWILIAGALAAGTLAAALLPPPPAMAPLSARIKVPPAPPGSELQFLGLENGKGRPLISVKPFRTDGPWTTDTARERIRHIDAASLAKPATLRFDGEIFVRGGVRLAFWHHGAPIKIDLAANGWEQTFTVTGQTPARFTVTIPADAFTPRGSIDARPFAVPLFAVALLYLFCILRRPDTAQEGLASPLLREWPTSRLVLTQGLALLGFGMLLYGPNFYVPLMDAEDVIFLGYGSLNLGDLLNNIGLSGRPISVLMRMLLYPSCFFDYHNLQFTRLFVFGEVVLFLTFLSWWLDKQFKNIVLAISITLCLLSLSPWNTDVLHTTSAGKATGMLLAALALALTCKAEASLARRRGSSSFSALLSASALYAMSGLGYQINLSLIAVFMAPFLYTQRTVRDLTRKTLIYLPPALAGFIVAFIVGKSISAPSFNGRAALISSGALPGKLAWFLSDPLVAALNQCLMPGNHAAPAVAAVVALAVVGGLLGWSLRTDRRLVLARLALLIGLTALSAAPILLRGPNAFQLRMLDSLFGLVCICLMVGLYQLSMKAQPRLTPLMPVVLAAAIFLAVGKYRMDTYWFIPRTKEIAIATHMLRSANLTDKTSVYFVPADYSDGGAPGWPPARLGRSITSHKAVYGSFLPRLLRDLPPERRQALSALPFAFGPRQEAPKGAVIVDLNDFGKVF
ncbi:MAG: hypothetical protein V3571_11455 [Pseudodesulfovibrio sp.]